MESIVKTPEPSAQSRTPKPPANIWRDIVLSGADCAQIEEVALEHLIDLQRHRESHTGGDQ